MTLKGRTALITGSTSGIGLAMAQALAGAGVHIILNGIGDGGDVEEARAAMERDHGVKARFIAADLTKPDEIAALAAQGIEIFGAIDILIANAGIQHLSRIEDFPVEAWDRVLAINLSSAFHAMRAVVPGMKARKWGRIIATASAHSLVALPNKAAYVAGKHAVVGLVKTVALETAAHGITVNAISPGFVRTPLVEGRIPLFMARDGKTEAEVVADILAPHADGRFVEAADIASLALYLCSDAAKSITGANISIDGGWTAR